MRLRVTPDSDPAALNHYWGRARAGKNLKPFFESLKEVPGGASVDLTQLLPPLPTALLYTFPLPGGTSVFLKGNEECLWTSFNFFQFPAQRQLFQSVHSRTNPALGLR